MVKQSERGLALLLVVSLMALVTLLVVSLAVVTRVETQVGATRSTQDEARQNAQLALQVALGQLQEMAGPDRRVTATAEATGSTSNPHWTGVWRSGDSETVPLSWLVSGVESEPSADSTPSRNRVVLVGDSNGVEDTEVVASIDVISELGIARGAYAYFVADEGVKARLMPALPTDASNDLVDQRHPLLGGTRPLGFVGETNVDPLNTAYQSRLTSLSSREQFPALLGSVDEEPSRDHWHDYTALSQGLLVDVNRGGLKTDLSDSGDTVISGLGAFSDLITPDRTASLSPIFPIRSASGSPGELYDGIHPIITQLGLQFSVHTISSSSRTLETRLRFFVELANPFSSALEAEDLRLVVSGMPNTIEIESRSLDATLEHGGATVELEPLYAKHTNAAGASAIEFDLPFEDVTWAPGRVVSWRLPSGNTMGESANRELEYDASTRTSYWRERPGSGLDGPDPLLNSSELRFNGAEDWRLQVELQRSNGEVLLSAELPEFYRVDTAWQDANSTLPDFGIHVRLVDRNLSQDADGASVWLRQDLPGDFRKEAFDETYWIPPVDLESASYNTSFSGPNSGVEARQLFNRDPIERESLSYYQPSFNSDIAFFELPRQDWRSVGALQHLAFENSPIYNVGNSWSERNDWFDRYFFSDYQLSDSVDTESLISGNFNLNSVNPVAWDAVLRGIGTGTGEYGFSFVKHAENTGDIEGVAADSISFPVARFGQSAGEVWEVRPNPDSFQAVLRTYRGGLRGLTDSQVAGLALEIARNVRTRITAQGPYRSVEAFLASDALLGGGNVLEYSIAQYDESVTASERINWDQYFPDAPMKIDTAAPTFVTSADLMTALAPVVNVRSDTFVIRAYGESVEPTVEADYSSSEPTARAWLEAVVQRYPEGVDATDFIGGASGDWSQMIAEPKWGRKFRVIALRWLSEDDL